MYPYKYQLYEHMFGFFFAGCLYLVVDAGEEVWTAHCNTRETQ